MNVKINQSIANGTIIAPPSKSYAHRYIIASLLSFQENTLHHVSLSEDIQATLNCCETFGAHYSFDKETLHLIPNPSQMDEPVFSCQESGSTLRFFLPIALLKYKKAVFTGSSKLLNRGIDVYKKIFINQEITIATKHDCIVVQGNLTSGEFFVPGDISSQYISGLLFVLPLLKGDSLLHILPPIESYPYIEMTLDVLKKYHIDIKRCGNDYYIKGNQHYCAKEFIIEGDYSNAAFLDVYNYLNGHVQVQNLNPNSLQGDKIYRKHFATLKEKSAIIDLSSCIDLGPVLFTFAAIHHGAKFIGTKRLVLKESNRIVDMVTELQKINAKIEVKENEVIIHKSEICPPTAPFVSHHDHRIAMALSMLNALYSITIEDAEAVAKSYPNFFEDLKKIGIEVVDFA